MGEIVKSICENIIETISEAKSRLNSFNVPDLCDENLDDTMKTTIKTLLDERNAKIEKSNKRISDINEELSLLEERYNNLEHEVDEMKMQYDEESKKLNSIKSKLSNLKDRDCPLAFKLLFGTVFDFNSNNVVGFMENESQYLYFNYNKNELTNEDIREKIWQDLELFRKTKT